MALTFRRWCLLLLLLLAAGAVVLLPPNGLVPFELTGALTRWWYSYDRAPSRDALRQDAGALAPETRLVVERNLAIIDQAIGEAEAALQSDPGNGALEQMVLARYEQRLALLRHATLSGRRES